MMGLVRKKNIQIALLIFIVLAMMIFCARCEKAPVPTKRFGDTAAGCDYSKSFSSSMELPGTTIGLVFKRIASALNHGFFIFVYWVAPNFMRRAFPKKLFL